MAQGWDKRVKTLGLDHFKELFGYVHLPFLSYVINLCS